MSTAQGAPERRLRLVPALRPVEVLPGREIGAYEREGGDRDQVDAAQSALIALVTRLRPDLPVDQAGAEVEMTLADFDARVAALPVDRAPVEVPAWRRRLLIALTPIALAGPPLVTTFICSGVAS